MESTLYREQIELRHPVRASGERHDVRARLYLRLEHDGVAGIGEVSPQPHALHGDAGEPDVLVALGRALSRVEEVSAREGELPHWTRVSRLGDARAADNVAYALIEMALLDRELHRDSRTLSELWEPIFDTPSQSTVSILDDEPWEVGDDAARVRVKCAPGSLSEEAARRLAGLSVPVLLDFNCSGGNDDAVLELVGAVSRHAQVAAIEQPFAVGNLVDPARLAERAPVPISLDESVRSLRDLTAIARYRAAEIVCVKPARVGGLANARTLIGRAQGLGLRPYLGGFFESLYARAVHRALARHCVLEASDVGEVATASASRTRPSAFGVGLSPILEGATVLPRGQTERS